MSEPFDRDAVAVRNLDKLAAELRQLGLAADIDRDSQPWPGLVVRGPAGQMLIMAGAAHFWRQSREKHVATVGPIHDPAATAREIHKHLRSKR